VGPYCWDVLHLFCLFFKHSYQVVTNKFREPGRRGVVVPSSRAKKKNTGSSGRAIEGVGLRQLACWNYRFESHRGHGCLSVVNFVCCCQVEVFATSWPVVQRSPNIYGASLWVISKPYE